MGLRTKLSIRLMALALTGMGQMSLAQVQTAQGTQSQIAVETFEAASTSLRAQYPDMVRQSGKVLTLNAAPDSNPVAERWGHFVLYAPLNRLWLLDDMDTVVEHAYIAVKQKPFDHLLLHWTHWQDRDIADILPAAAQLPVFTVESTTPHPLATAYDALLAKPLARALAPLPAGAYFSAAGHVFDAAGAQIADWDSYGPQIALRLMPAVENSTSPAVTTRTEVVLRLAPVETEAEASDTAPTPDPAATPLWHWFSVADLATALTPEQPFEQGDQ